MCFFQGRESEKRAEYLKVRLVNREKQIKGIRTFSLSLLLKYDRLFRAMQIYKNSEVTINEIQKWRNYEKNT